MVLHLHHIKFSQLSPTINRSCIQYFCFTFFPTGWPKLKYPAVNLQYFGNGIKFYDEVHNINFRLITE